MDFAGYEIAVMGLLAKIVTVIAALIVVHIMGMLYDRSDKIDSTKAYDLIEADARAAANYYGYRVLAFCVLVGFILS